MLSYSSTAQALCLSRQLRCITGTLTLCETFGQLAELWWCELASGSGHNNPWRNGSFCPVATLSCSVAHLSCGYDKLHNSLIFNPCTRVCTPKQLKDLAKKKKGHLKSHCSSYCYTTTNPIRTSKQPGLVDIVILERAICKYDTMRGMHKVW